jgi:hypothetical protein
VGLQNKPIISYAVFLIVALLLKIITDLLFTMEQCGGKSLRSCYQIMVPLIFSTLKVGFSSLLIVLAVNMPKSEIEQMKTSIKKSFSLGQPLDNTFEEEEETDNEGPVRNTHLSHFFMSIDKMQKLNEHGQFCHLIKYTVKSKIGSVSNSSSDLYRSNDELSLKKMSEQTSEGRFTLTDPHKYFEIYKTEEEIKNFCMKLQSFYFNKFEEVDLLDNIDNSRVDLSNMEILVNKIMNEVRSSLLIDEKMEQLSNCIMKFLEIDHLSKNTKVWMPGIFLLIDFHSEYNLLEDQTEKLFPNLRATAIKRVDPLNVFHINIFNSKTDLSIVLKKSLSQIESFVQKVFENLVLPSNTQHANFEKEIRNILNVCLNENPNKFQVGCFLGMSDFAHQVLASFKFDFSFEVVSFYGQENMNLQYKIIVELSSTKTVVHEIIRSVKHFNTFSNHLGLRLPQHDKFKPDQFGDSHYLKHWLQKVLQLPTIWKLSETKLFFELHDLD